MSDEFEGARQGDWVIFCDICGRKCWASESVQLDTYTGRGGLRVCPEDADPIDYGLVPFKVPAERSVPFVRDAIYSGNEAAIENLTVYPPINVETDDPMSTTPEDLRTEGLIWDQQSVETWDNWQLHWGK